MSIVNAASNITTSEFRTPTDFTIVTGLHSVMSVLMTLLVGDIEVNSCIPTIAVTLGMQQS